MTSSAGTDAIVALEDDPPASLFDSFPGTGIGAWPLLRTPLARWIAEVELNTALMPVRRLRGHTELNRVRTHLPNPHDAAAARASEHLFIVSGTTTAPAPRGRSNWLVDDHAESLGDGALVLQESRYDLLTGRRSRPAHAQTLSLYRLSMDVRAAARGFVPSDAQTAFVDALIEDVVGGLGVPVPPGRRASARAMLLSRLATSIHYDRLLWPLIERIGPRVVYLQGASYGARAPLVARLHEAGVHVAEHQHGVINSSHASYNFGTAFREPPLRTTLPDTLLTFGEHWTEGVRFPNAVVPIGRPYLERRAAKASPAERRPNSLLVISSAFEREALTGVVLTLRALLPASWRIALRPHPIERSTVRQLYPVLDDNPGVDFDDGGDLYDSLAGSRAVIGYASTALFEALAFDCRVMVLDSRLADLYAPAAIFERLRSDRDVTAAARSLAAGESVPAAPDPDLDRIWKPGAAAAFAAFVAGIGQDGARGA